MKGERNTDKNGVTFTFTPSAMPPGTQLFIGYLTPAPKAARGGPPGPPSRRSATFQSRAVLS